MTATAAALGLTAHQFRNLCGMVAATQTFPDLRGDKRPACILVAASLAESGMNMYANVNVPESFSGKYQYVLIPWAINTWTKGLGQDHASVGMLQQQVGPTYTKPVDADPFHASTVKDDTWGTVAELMDPLYSAICFLQRLRTAGWQSGDPWAAAQRVQGSAYGGTPSKANNFSSIYGGNYKATYPRAQQLVNAVWDQIVTHPSIVITATGGMLSSYMILTNADTPSSTSLVGLGWWRPVTYGLPPGVTLNEADIQVLLDYPLCANPKGADGHAHAIPVSGVRFKQAAGVIGGHW